MQHWSSLEGYKYGDDSLGIIQCLGREPTPMIMTLSFPNTSLTGWGNVMSGGIAKGVYAEIIRGIKADGFEKFMSKFLMPEYYGYRRKKKNVKRDDAVRSKTRRREKKTREYINGILNY